jgi:hypothetical protein
VNSIVTQTLFDQYGRGLPVSVTAPAHQESRRWFQFRQPEVDYGKIYARTVEHLAGGKTPQTTAAEFESRAKAILARLQTEPALSNVTLGVGIPFLIPADDIVDYGQALEEKYIPGVAHSFKAALPDYDFTSHNTARLAGNISIAKESRHDRLVTTASKNDVVGFFFPSLLEYSVPAARQVMAALPDEFLLAGGIDTSAALIGSPDLFLRLDGYPPLIWLSALNGEKDNIGYHFEAYGYNLTFNRRPHLGQAAEYWSSALVVLG